MMKFNKGSNKKIKKEPAKILEEKVIIDPPNGIPYLHFNEQLYMQKAKIKLCRRERDFANYVDSIFIIPIFYRFFRVPYRIAEQREMAYKIYLEESKDFRKKHSKEAKEPDKYKFELHYCSKK